MILILGLVLSVDRFLKGLFVIALLGAEDDPLQERLEDTIILDLSDVLGGRQTASRELLQICDEVVQGLGGADLVARA